MVDRIRYPTVSYLPFYYVFFQFLLLTIFNLQANILTAKDTLSNLEHREHILLTSSLAPICAVAEVFKKVYPYIGALLLFYSNKTFLFKGNSAVGVENYFAPISDL